MDTDEPVLWMPQGGDTSHWMRSGVAEHAAAAAAGAGAVGGSRHDVTVFGGGTSHDPGA
jgi:hypothetical protein